MKVREGYHSEQVRNKSFGEILDSLGRLQREVLDVIKQYGPLSNEQIAEHLGKWPHTITPRVLELRKLELVEFAGTKVSPTSGKVVSLWKIKHNEFQLKLY